MKLNDSHGGPSGKIMAYLGSLCSYADTEEKFAFTESLCFIATSNGLLTRFRSREIIKNSFGATQMLRSGIGVRGIRISVTNVFIY